MTSSPENVSIFRTPVEAVLLFMEKRRRWVFTGILLLYLAGYNGLWRIDPDSALYLSLGRNLAQGQGFTYLGESHNWAEPGLPLVISAVFRAYGIDVLWPVLAVMLLAGVAALALNYWLFQLHAGRGVAVTMTALLALCETFFRYAFHIYTDMMFIVGVLAFLVGYERLMGESTRRQWLSWSLIAAGTLWMAAFRPVVYTFLGALAFTTCWKLWKSDRRRQHLLVLALSIACFLSFRLLDPRRESIQQVDYREDKLRSMLTERLPFVLKRSFTECLPMLAGETTVEAVYGTQLLDTEIVFGIGTIAATLMLFRRRVLWGFWTTATLAQMAFWLPRERYFLPILPFVLYSLWLVYVWLHSRPRRIAAIAGHALAVLVVVPNVILVSRFVVQQHRPPVPETADSPEKTGMIRMADAIKGIVSNGDLVVAESGDRELSYFSHRRVIAPPSTLRLPPTSAQWQAFEKHLRTGENLFVVRTGGKEDTIAPMLKEMNATLGLALVEITTTTSSGRKRTWTLMRLEMPPASTR